MTRPTNHEPDSSSATGEGVALAAGSDAAFARRVRTTRALQAQRIQDYGIVVLGAVIFIYFALTTKDFLTGSNLLNILNQNAEVGIAACAVTLTIISGNFDLSIGAIFALAGVLAAWAAVHLGVWWCFPVALLSGTVMGLGNGLLVAKLGVNAFLATLASALIFAGIALGVTKGFLIQPKSGTEVFTFIGQSKLASVNYSSIIFVLVAIVCQFVLAFTPFGRRIYGMGDNRVAARLAGVKIARMVIATFVITGLACGLSGLIDVSFTGSGSADVGANLALTAVAAVALGGTSIFGGTGAVWRTVVGVLVLGMLSNGFDLAGLAQYWQNVIVGCLIIGAIALQAAVRRQ
jgi:ribose transport system permease protein